MNSMTLSAQEIAELREVAAWLERTIKRADDRQELTITEDDIKELENLSCTAARVMGRFFAIKERDFQKQVLKMSTFGERLRTLRKHNNMTRAELAERCNVSFSSLESYEIGRRKPSIKVLCSIAYWLQTTLDVLFGRDVDELKKAKENAGQWK